MSSPIADRSLAVRLSELSVTFGENRAVDNVSFEIMPGEVHGLVGQNGSGKSTLIKVLAGYHVPEPGALLQLGDRHVTFPMNRAALKGYGLAFVHQDLGLIPQLSVLENFLIGELSVSHRRWISWSDERDRASRTFENFGLDIDPTAKLASLSLAQQAMLAIVRAVEEITSGGVEGEARGGLLVLDEPTAYLPENDKDHLFQLIREVAASGQSVLFVSHYLEEVLEITDQVSVLRDGKVVCDFDSETLTTELLVEAIIGRSLDSAPLAAQPVASGNVGLAVRDLTGRLVNGADLDIREGEILGVTGLLGSGFDEIGNLIFGA
jgi:ribose transport system ATP-binding protein